MTTTSSICRVFWTCAFAALLIAPANALKDKEIVLHSFAWGTDGAHPIAGLIRDARTGNLYGTTSNGGSSFEGDVFALSPNGSGGWNYQVIYTFSDCMEACYPSGSLAVDAQGNVYGTTSIGGVNNTGTIYELTPAVSGTWSLKTLYSFGVSNSGDGDSPNGVTYFQGALYGTTFMGGLHEGGTVFQLAPNGSGWGESVLHSFALNNVDGEGPNAAVTFDAKGNLYGTTSLGGPSLSGTVFELVHQSGGKWSERILYSFTGGADGLMPWHSGVVFDKRGNLYGTTSAGGTGQLGTVFELTPSGSSWTESVLHSFSGGADGQGPNGGVAVDAQGRVYGKTTEGGGGGYCTNPPDTTNVYCGIAFALVQSSTGAWTELVLHHFSDQFDGGMPLGTLVLDETGSIYGVANQGGAAPQVAGLVYELTIVP